MKIWYDKDRHFGNTRGQLYNNRTKIFGCNKKKGLKNLINSSYIGKFKAEEETDLQVGWKSFF